MKPRRIPINASMYKEPFTIQSCRISPTILNQELTWDQRCLSRRECAMQAMQYCRRMLCDLGVEDAWPKFRRSLPWRRTSVMVSPPRSSIKGISYVGVGWLSDRNQRHQIKGRRLLEMFIWQTKWLNIKILLWKIQIIYCKFQRHKMKLDHGR